ncbi:hypothetical protein GCM10010452_61450 [Crossiella cryophila]
MLGAACVGRGWMGAGRADRLPGLGAEECRKPVARVPGIPLLRVPGARGSGTNANRGANTAAKHRLRSATCDNDWR